MSARQDALPDGRAILARHVAAIGGASAFAKIRSMHAKGHFEIPAQGIGGDLEILSARPARLVWRATVPGIGVLATGYDGHTAWLVNPISGPEVFSGRMLSEAADDAWFDQSTEGDQIKQATTLEKTTFDKRPAFKVHVVFTSGNEETQYFDADSGLQIGSEATRAMPQGVVPIVNTRRNYQKFGDLLQPTVFVQSALGFDQVVTVTSIDYNAVPDSAFDLPAEIKALIKP